MNKGKQPVQTAIIRGGTLPLFAPQFCILHFAFTSPKTVTKLDLSWTTAPCSHNPVGGDVLDAPIATSSRCMMERKTPNNSIMVRINNGYCYPTTTMSTACFHGASRTSPPTETGTNFPQALLKNWFKVLKGVVTWRMHHVLTSFKSFLTKNPFKKL